MRFDVSLFIVFLFLPSLGVGGFFTSSSQFDFASFSYHLIALERILIPSHTLQLVVLKGSVFMALRNLFHSHRAATRDLMLALPLGADLDTPALYIAHIPLAEFGVSLTLPCVAGNEQVHHGPE